MSKIYLCHEYGMEEKYTELELTQTYVVAVDKKEYPTLNIWIDDMLKMGILIEENDWQGKIYVVI